MNTAPSLALLCTIHKATLLVGVLLDQTHFNFVGLRGRLLRFYILG